MSGLRSSVHYSYSFKKRVIDEVLSGEISKEEAGKKYGIRGHSTISKWLRKLDRTHYPSIKMKLSDKVSEQRRIKELEEALAYEKLKSRALEEMINIAEEQLKISIRKKSDTKQSKK